MVEESVELDSFVADKNICRVIKACDGDYLTAAYHLDKESGTKSGELLQIKVTDDLK
jgi:hypothetical protein